MFQSKKAHSTYLLLNKVVNEVSTLYEQLNSIENKQFTSNYFIQIQQQLQQSSYKKAAAEIQDLKNILDRFDMRLNVFVFFFLNSFLLWDARQMLALNTWKQKHTDDINNWFLAIASTEVSISIAMLHVNQPKFCFPSISPIHFEFKATDLGHPLIQNTKRINNNFSQNGIGNIALITGSNMGGKSTFLRSVGINTVLALMGSPVCATEFTISNVHLMSSMRIADNLAESTSTFYAELKKLQVIIEAVKQQRKVFVLLDEILRGTNSFDRHTGSKALIQQFIKQHAVAIIATHDVELAALENQFPNAMNNYHFDVQVANEELYFDYKLKNRVRLTNKICLQE
jgi:DNA mismatch repair ATPase MutS